MLVSRILKPKKGQILYHYCSVETLCSIAEYKKVRFSDINMMNDYMETGYPYGVFEEAATEILNHPRLLKKFPGIGKEFFDRVDEVITRQQFTLHPVIACFSKSPDVLSQWRGYADNARGVSIGFDAQLLDKMPASLLEVEYNRGKQVSEMRTALLAIYMAEVQRGSNWGQAFRDDCRLLMAWSHGFKSKAFEEEQEVRLLHVLTVKAEKDRICLIDEDSEGDHGAVIPGQPVKFRTFDGSIIAYVDIPLPEPDGESLIPELWIGPCNNNSPGNLMYLLGGHEITKTTLKLSSATYR